MSGHWQSLSLAVGVFCWHGEAEMKNPPAFPRSMFSQNGPFSSSAYSEGYGMDLRDYFAAKAMQNFLSTVGWNSDQKWFDEIAVGAYRMADAMLKAREA